MPRMLPLALIAIFLASCAGEPLKQLDVEDCYSHPELGGFRCTKGVPGDAHIVKYEDSAKWIAHPAEVDQAIWGCLHTSEGREMMEAMALQQIAAEQQCAADMRAKILKLEAAMLAMPPEHQVHIEPKHYFAPGLYLREITIPEGVALTGAIHRTEHYCILSHGEVSVRTENGIRRIKAPAVIHSLPGMKRVLYAHEESVWINVHHNPTNERDLDQIDKIYTAKNFEELGHVEHVQIEERK
jgi:hypothetical protein